MPKKKPAKRWQTKRPPWDVGRKIGRWLADQVHAGRHPINRAELARAIGVTQANVGFWVRKGAKPSQRNLYALAKVMGVDMAWLSNDARGWDERVTEEDARASWTSLTREQRELFVRAASMESGMQALEAALAALRAAYPPKFGVPR